MDQLYLNKVRKGDTSAFSYFIRSYQQKAYAIAMSIVKHPPDAQDVVQESFIQAYTSLGDLRQGAKFSSWLFKIVVNKSLQLLRKQKRITDLEDVKEVGDGQQASCNDALASLEREQLKELVEYILEKLSAKEALVLQLFYLEEYRIKEIEEITGFSKANVKTLLHRARNNFYHVLRQQNKDSLTDILF